MVDASEAVMETKIGVVEFTSFACAAFILVGCDIGPAIERLPRRRSVADIVPRRRVILGR
jgi:hypothetical protein